MPGGSPRTRRALRETGWRPRRCRLQQNSLLRERAIPKPNRIAVSCSLSRREAEETCFAALPGGAPAHVSTGSAPAITTRTRSNPIVKEHRSAAWAVLIYQPEITL